MHNTPLPKRVTSQVLAELLQITPSRLSGLVRENKIPPATGDGYALLPSVHGYLAALRRTHTDGSLNQARLVKLKAEGKLAELSCAEKERELIPAADVMRVWSKCCIAVRQLILAADVPRTTKEDICRQFQELPVDSYLSEPADADADDTSS